MKKYAMILCLLLLLPSCSTLKGVASSVCKTEKAVSETITNGLSFFGTPGEFTATVVTGVLDVGCTIVTGGLHAVADPKSMLNNEED